MAKLKEGDRCKLWNDDYLDLKINKILPKLYMPELYSNVVMFGQQEHKT